MVGSRVRPTAVAVGLAAAALLAGCYTLQPTGRVTPDVGTRVAFDVNDQGRAALGGAMGPEIDQIEGRLVQRDTSDFVVAVTAVHLLRGGEQIWTGEQVHIKSAYVNQVYARQFSSGRTIALSAIGVVAVGVFVSRSLNPGGNPNAATDPTDTAKTVRIPIGKFLLPNLSWP